MKNMPALYQTVILLIGLLCTTGYSKTDVTTKTKNVPKKQKTVSLTKESGTASKEEKWGNAPDFALPRIDGTIFRLSETKNNVTILNFWATWCPHCQTEIADFIKITKDYREKGVEIVAVAFERNPDDLKDFVAKKSINYTVLAGTREILGKYKDVVGIPATYIIDKNGDIAFKQMGKISGETLEKKIKILLKNKN